MAIHPDIKKHENEQTENKANVDGTSQPPICMKCNNVISHNEEGVQSEKPNQIELDSTPRYPVDNSFLKDDEGDCRLVEEREKKARREWETKKKEELERQSIISIHDQPSTSQSTHLEGRQRMNNILDQLSTSQSTHLEGRQRMNSILDQPSTSQSTHLEGRQRMNSILDQPPTSQSIHLEGRQRMNSILDQPSTSQSTHLERRQRMNSILDQPSTSQSTHLEGRQRINSILDQPSTSQSTHLEGRQRMNSILNQPSKSQSTHLEGLTQSHIEGAVKNNKNVTVVPVNNQLQHQNLYNNRPLRADAETYELENFSKNVMLILNHYDIDSYPKPREGTHKDVESLKNTFEKYNFTIIEREDRTRDEIFEILDEFCQNDFSEFGCVSVVVLTHGEDGGLLHAKDTTYHESDILQRIETHKNPSLVTKPKLFIFQACRGRHPSQSIRVQTRTVRLDGVDEDFYTLPIESDILILHSAYPGNASHRETEYGSWLIQTLCKRINELANKENLLTIVTRVQRDVAIDRENIRLDKWTSQNRVDKQMPVITSTLIRKFELRAFTEKSKTTGSTNAMKQTEADYIEVSHLRIVNGIDLNYFNYIKKCTAIYSEEIENLNDDFAKCLLNLARTFGSGQEFDKAKMTMANAMCEHLKRNIKNKETYKYLYLKSF